MIIGCDIGGVLKNLISDEPFEGAIETINKLAKNNKIIFISKCGINFQEKISEWLKKYGLDKFEIYFCKEITDKFKIAEKTKISAMIDDNLNVLKTMPLGITRYWFCNEMQKIKGAKKFQPEIFNSVVHVNSWENLLKKINVS